MINVNVTPFIRVSGKHLFYENDMMRDLQIIPSAETQKLMHKMGIFIKNDSNRVVLGYSERTLTYFEDASSKVMLVFNLKSGNPFFQSITKLDVYLPDKKIFYFDNSNKNANTENVTFLHESAFASSHNLYDKNKERIEFLSERGVNEVKVSDSLGKIIQTHSIKSVEDENKVLIDLTKDSPGLFQISEDDKNHAPFYCSSDDFNEFFGVVHLYLDAGMIRVPEESKKYTFDYEIKFENRETHWRFYFLNSQFKEFPDFNITHPKENIVFSTPELKYLQNGSAAWEIVSKTKIQLKENYEDFFTITFKLNEESKHEVSISLPNADYRKTRRVVENNVEKMYSDTYVYL